ncbi:TIGR04222 domain-containing membrane protein [Dactylosporangium sp. NPDC006015]|uniref:TIGR04222 domain-containing membrane protein n=1 Tax=Dactylosporangium sp. NPDC006015 TaxID=3154576 RepID=UPI0033B711E4
MRTIVMAGDTWGVSGPDFLLLFHAAAVVAAGVALLGRWLRLRRLERPGTSGLGAEQLAMMNARRPGAVDAALAALRARGAVEAADCVVSRSAAAGDDGALPGDATPLERALLAAVRVPARAGELQLVAEVAAALDAIDDDLRRRGLRTDHARERRLTIGRWVPLGAVLAVGVVRLLAGVLNHRPVSLLLLSLVLYGVLLFVAVNVDAPRARDASSVWAAARRAHPHLAPHLNPAWATYGPAGAATAVALWGDTALRAGDPAFFAGLRPPPAQTTTAPRPRRAPAVRTRRRTWSYDGGTTTSHYSCGSSGGSGGTSCGGGGGGCGG